MPARACWSTMARSIITGRCARRCRREGSRLSNRLAMPKWCSKPCIIGGPRRPCRCSTACFPSPISTPATVRCGLPATVSASSRCRWPRRPERIVFASEDKAILACDGFPRDIDSARDHLAPGLAEPQFQLQPVRRHRAAAARRPVEDHRWRHREAPLLACPGCAGHRRASPATYPPTQSTWRRSRRCLRTASGFTASPMPASPRLAAAASIPA